MLKKIKPTQTKVKRAGGCFAIIASEYNPKYVNAMLKAAKKTLQDAGVDSVRVIRVPGAFEIPVIVSKLLSETNSWSAIICLGVILRGETVHAQTISDVVSRLLGQMAVQSGVPMIHEVLLLENTAQADKRCLSPEHNRGAEAAQTALAMHKVVNSMMQMPF